MIAKLIQQACDNLKIAYKLIDTDGIFFQITFKNGRQQLCIANDLGLNSSVVAKICDDKAFAHTLLGQSIAMPNTTVYVDPFAPHPYTGFSNVVAHEEIVADICGTYFNQAATEGAQSAQNPQDVAVVLKPNSKSMGVHVFVCKNRAEVAHAVPTIFDQQSYHYDHVLLAQEYIRVQKEYRVIVYNRKIMLAYHKDNTDSSAQFVGNLSPLHFKNARAVLVEDQKLLAQLESFLKPLFVTLPVMYAGLDVVQDATGAFCLLEINSKPGFSYFIADNSQELVVELFEKILTDQNK